MKIRDLKDVRAVVDAIGRERLMEITGKRTNNIGNWLLAGHFPPETYVVVNHELDQIGCRAPASLWPRMIQPKRSDRAAA